MTDRKALLTRATMQARSACAAPSKAALGARKVRLGVFFLGGESTFSYSCCLFCCWKDAGVCKRFLLYHSSEVSTKVIPSCLFLPLSFTRLTVVCFFPLYFSNFSGSESTPFSTLLREEGYSPRIPQGVKGKSSTRLLSQHTKTTATNKKPFHHSQNKSVYLLGHM